MDAREELKSWGGGGSGEESSITKLAVAKLISILRYHDFYEMVKKDGSEYRKWAKKPIEHPLPSIDQGKRFVDCTTDLSSYEIEHVANMLVKVNDKATSKRIHATNSEEIIYFRAPVGYCERRREKLYLCKF